MRRGRVLLTGIALVALVLPAATGAAVSAPGRRHERVSHDPCDGRLRGRCKGRACGLGKRLPRCRATAAEPGPCEGDRARGGPVAVDARSSARQCRRGGPIVRRCEAGRGRSLRRCVRFPGGSALSVFHGCAGRRRCAVAPQGRLDSRHRAVRQCRARCAARKRESSSRPRDHPAERRSRQREQAHVDAGDLGSARRQRGGLHDRHRGRGLHLRAARAAVQRNRRPVLRCFLDGGAEVGVRDDR